MGADGRNRSEPPVTAVVLPLIALGVWRADGGRCAACITVGSLRRPRAARRRRAPRTRPPRRARPRRTGDSFRSRRAWPFAPAPSADELRAQLERLAKDQGPIKTNWTPPGKSDRYGHAEGLIAAPYDVVKARLLDFPHYKELAGPKFKKVSVVDKSASGTDLYFQLPIMKGLVTIWYVTRFGAARPGMGGAEVIEGKFVKGNIKDMQIAFTIRPAPAPSRRPSSCAI